MAQICTNSDSRSRDTHPPHHPRAKHSTAWIILLIGPPATGTKTMHTQRNIGPKPAAPRRRLVHRRTPIPSSSGHDHHSFTVIKTETTRQGRHQRNIPGLSASGPCSGLPMYMRLNIYPFLAGIAWPVPWLVFSSVTSPTVISRSVSL